MAPVINVLSFLLDLYLWIVILSAVSSWLIAFDVVNAKNRYVQVALHYMSRLTDPVYRRIRKVIPPLGGVDISPIIVIIAITMIQQFLSGFYFRSTAEFYIR